jgi:hypothetical protein
MGLDSQAIPTFPKLHVVHVGSTGIEPTSAPALGDAVVRLLALRYVGADATTLTSGIVGADATTLTAAYPGGAPGASSARSSGAAAAGLTGRRARREGVRGVAQRSMGSRISRTASPSAQDLTQPATRAPRRGGSTTTAASPTAEAIVVAGAPD